MTLRWIGHEQRYEYLSADDSKLYALVVESGDEKDKTIKSLLEKIANSSRAAHQRSTY